MIQKSLDAIAEDDLLALIRGGVAEGRTVEYKRELPGNTDADKKEFLADASSFANTSGGDLIFGIEEDKGVPTQIVGYQAGDVDLEIRRLDSILAAGLDPRIRYAMKIVLCAGGQKVLVLRTERSWSGPHRVIFKGHDRFYGRNSGGKYPLDVNELRGVFTFSNSISERIRAFRTDRIIALSKNDMPVPFVEDSRIVLHCIPLESFAGQPQYDLLPYYRNAASLQPMACSAWDRRLNLEGLIAFGGQSPYRSYIQVYRTGIIEVVQGSILSHEYKGQLMIPSIAYERYILEYLPKCFNVLNEIGSGAPVVVSLSLLKTRGLVMAVDNLMHEPQYPIREESLILPETLVQELSTPAAKILKPMFDLVWNACGYPGSQNFDADGNWVGRR